MGRILLIEDSVDVQVLVREVLGGKHEVVCASSGAETFEILAKSAAFDLILLDVVLPDTDGFNLFLKLSNDEHAKDAPVIFLTGRSSTTDKVAGLSLGAEDYIVKPFDPFEFNARIEVRLRKARDKKSPAKILKKGDLKLNLSFQKAFLVNDGEESDLNLSPVEFKLLQHFVRHEEHVLSREQLMVAVRGDQITAMDRTIDKHVSSLRRKLGTRGEYIQTIVGEGYRFSTDVRQVRKAS